MELMQFATNILLDHSLMFNVYCSQLGNVREKAVQTQAQYSNPNIQAKADFFS